MQPRPLTRIQIDCAQQAQQGQTSHGMFNGLPLECTLHNSKKQVFPTTAASERATESEREVLIPSDNSRNLTKTPRVVLLDGMTRASLIFCACSCTLLTITVITILGLTYDRISVTVSQVDESVSIANTARFALSSVNHILNSTARAAHTIDQLSGISINAAMFSTPHLSKMLNTTHDTLNDVHHLIQHPTISIGSAGR